MSEARPAKMTAARFERLHNEQLQAAGALSFDDGEREGFLSERPTLDYARQCQRDALTNAMALTSHLLAVRTWKPAR